MPLVELTVTVRKSTSNEKVGVSAFWMHQVIFGNLNSPDFQARLLGERFCEV